MAAWLMIVLTGSIVYERIQPKKSSSSSMGVQIAQALSIRCSFKAFKTSRFRVRYHQGERVRVDLSMLDCFRSLMCLGVVLGHCGYLLQVYMRSMANKIAQSTDVPSRMGQSLSRIVDTYFFFFGLMATYTMMRKFNARQLANPNTWMVVNAGRLLRITPLFMLIFWYNKSISPYTASGPWWDYGVNRYSQRGLCMADPWWRSVPYFGCSSKRPMPACNPPGWFIVSYSQISLLLPLMTYVICKLPNHCWRLLLVTLLSLISVGQLAIKLKLQTSINLEQSQTLGSLMPDLMEKFESTGFLSTITKLGTVAVGCWAGYLLKEYESGNIPEWPRWMRNKLTLMVVNMLHFFVVFLPMIGYYLANLNQHSTITATEFIVSSTGLMLLWSVLNTILFINCTTTYNSHYAIRFAGHSIWRAFNKLGLGLYLIHWEVIHVGVTGFEQAPSHGFITDIMKLWAFGVFFSLIFALVLHILFEAPLAALTTLLFNRLLSSDNGNSKQSTGEPKPTPLSTIAKIEQPPKGHN